MTETSDNWVDIKAALCAGLEGEDLLFASEVFEEMLDIFEAEYLQTLLPVASQLLRQYHIRRDSPMEFINDAFGTIKVELNKHNEYETTVYSDDFDIESSVSFSDYMYDDDAECLASIAKRIKELMVPTLH